jgi:hypothetical protein
MTVSRAEARELMSRGYEMGATVVNGVVERLEDGSWIVDGRPVEQWLRDLEGREIVLVAAEISAGRGKVQVCRTCGTEYEGHDCPRCREIHRRLRGR